jgi:hypothetical protein
LYAGLAQPEHRPPVAEHGQTVPRETNRGANYYKSPGPKPLWLIEIEAAEKASAADCSTEQECRAEKRNYSDLRAQWTAAYAAEGQQTLALWQTHIAGIATLIAGIGTIFLITTFKETRRAANEARKGVIAAQRANRIAALAAKHARHAYIADRRPWVLVEAKIAGDVVVSTMDVRIPMILSIRNVGKTPAIGAIVHAQVVQNPIDGNVAEQARRLCAEFYLKQVGNKTRAGDILGQDGRPLDINRSTIALVERLNARQANGMVTAELYIIALAFYRSSDGQSKPFETCVVYDVLFEQSRGKSRCFVIEDRGSRRAD